MRAPTNFVNSNKKVVKQPEIIPALSAHKKSVSSVKSSAVKPVPSPKMIRIADPKYSENFIRVSVGEAGSIRKEQDLEELEESRRR
jgi:hypothetical protein